MPRLSKKHRDDMSILIRDGLMRLIDDVLFLEDPDRQGYYHPRISAQHTHVYHSLDEDQKSCFNRLYDDFYYHRHDVFWKRTSSISRINPSLIKILISSLAPEKYPTILR